MSRWAASLWCTPSCRVRAIRRSGWGAVVALLAAFVAGSTSAGTAPSPADDALACDKAGATVEASLALPAGLLRAIGRVESGRRDPVTGLFAAWPWTINANGQGRFFSDAASAAAAVRALRASGTASIDVGCYQVNLMHHPLAFLRVEDGFDPAMNAAYAGAFLQALRQRHGNWEAAVAAYHSATAERGDAYRQRVYAAWNPGAPVALPAPRQIGPVVIRISGPDLSGPESVIRVWAPSRPGAAPSRIAMPAPVAAPVALVAVAMPASPAGTAIGMDELVAEAALTDGQSRPPSIDAGPMEEQPPHGVPAIRVAEGLISPVGVLAAGISAAGISAAGISAARLPTAAMQPAALIAPAEDPSLPAP